MARRETLALIAHDEKKDDLVRFATRHRERLAGYRLVATGTTGARIKAVLPELDITPMKSGPLGGDQQIGALIAEGQVAGLIFFIDPLTSMPHDVDVKALTRLAVLYDIPMALNARTAELILAEPASRKGKRSGKAKS